MKSHSLKFLRIVVAIVSLFALTWLFVDFTGAAAVRLAWLAKIQLVPALLAVNVVVILILALLTLVFGRLYCSVICPLGITQDIVIWLRRVFSSKKNRRLGLYRFTPEHKAWRYGFLGLFIVVAVLGLISLVPMSFAGILDPYSIYGRIAGQGIVPLWRGGASAVAEAQAANGNYLFAGEVPAALANFNIAVSVVAAVTFIIVTVFAIRTGRGYCNTVCPVGTILGFLSRFSLLRPLIDESKCNRCGSCGRKCKAKCIDTKNHVIDLSRCVVCLDCINNCTQGAISYGSRRKTVKKAVAAESGVTTVKAEKTDNSRRAFLVGTAIVAGAAAASAADKVTDGGLAPIKAKKRHKDAAPAVPAGAISLRHFRSHCTACQLCISECPNNVLRPGTSLDGFMQPVMVFTDGFCRTDCNRCSQVCPTGALRPIPVEEKTAWKIGTAVVDPGICISAAYGQACGNCVRHCPAEAISMVKGENGHMRPVVNESICIGCGNCEYHCPAGRAGQLSSNKAAIYVNGIEVHQKI